MVFWRISAIILVLSSVNCAEQCEKGWREYKNNCYHFSKTKLNWRDARAACEKMEAHMATEMSEGDHDYLVQQIILEKTSHNWLGASEIDRPGVWAWESTGERIKFSKWYPGQPGDKKQNCLLLNAGLKYDWDDYTCTNKYSFVCVKAANLVNPPCCPVQHCCNYRSHC